MAIAGAGGVVGCGRPLRRCSRTLPRRRRLLRAQGGLYSAVPGTAGETGGGGARIAAYVNITSSLAIAALLVLLAYAVMRPLVLTSQLPTRGGLPLAMGLVFVGLFIVITRKKALAQIVGFLVLENGIALLALLGTFGIPLIVELGVFLDVMMGFLVMQVFVYHIHGTLNPSTSNSSINSDTDEERRIIDMNFALLLFRPLLSALLAYVVRPYRVAVGWAGAWLSLVSLGSALAFAASLLAGSEAPTFGPSEMLRADSLSALLMACIAGVATLALFFSPGLGRESPYDAAQLRRYHVFVNLFIFAMLLAVSANNVGIMWIAVEATTIFSAMVIPLALTKASVEASWKYILISSVGITLAFAGTVLAYFDFVALSGRTENALNWPVLLSAAPHLHPEVMRLAFVFLLVGFGTKAGIAPMHTWLPDAHSEAPSPLSAMMSGVLLAVALYAITRWKVVVDATLGPAFSNQLLLLMGLFSLLVAAFSLVLQRNYKRMLAYSSIEHTGLICIGLGLGPLECLPPSCISSATRRPSQCCSYCREKCSTITAAQNWIESRAF